ncbi:helix-turn-helix domain-containing protein, partial [Escherichia coli]|uniref:helix-turn-helix domain-containing protein n=1 Tax=Escherichia coli TaxID=562 RepID=UPI0021DA9D55
TMYNLVRSGIIPIKRKESNAYIFSRQVILKLMGINHDIHEPFLTPKEVAELLNIKQIDVAHYAKFHKIPFYKLVNKKGAQCLYLKSEIDAA